MLTVPKFETERQEADWWYDNRHLLEEEFFRAIKSGRKPGPSMAVRRLAEMRGTTVEEMQAQMRANGSGTPTPEAVSLPKLPRSA
jgi:hypothetical protein